MLMTGKQKDRQTDNQTDRLVNSPGTSKEALSETCVVGYGGRVQTDIHTYRHTCHSTWKKCIGQANSYFFRRPLRNFITVGKYVQAD